MNHQAEALTVKELTQKIKTSLEQEPGLNNVWLRAEISNFTHHTRGHMYFTLKDQHARIRAVMFAGHNRYLKFNPHEGMKVLARGEVNVYERDGQYQFYVKEMQPDGIGALYQAFEELKRKLEQRGWFAAERKKPLPTVPKRIGVITSQTGAAIRDVITTLKRRFPIAEILVIPVLVQGEHAPLSIKRGIELAHRHGDIDVLIVGRGGGSIEELWAFNEELVAEAIIQSQIPIISAVGHETDYTIADFVADLRAPTPTAAAELAVPLLYELEERVNGLQLALKRHLLRLVQQKRNELQKINQRHAFRLPQRMVTDKEQALDQQLLKLKKAMEQLVQGRKQHVQQACRHLMHLSPKARLGQAQTRLAQMERQLQREMHSVLQKKRDQLGYTVSQLDAYSPLKIMTKGYSLIYSTERELYRSVKQIEPGQAVIVRMHDGQLDCQVWGIMEDETNEPE
jgi:exodeoxyribonuclease VII large subunit